MAFLRRDKGDNCLVSSRWAGQASNRPLDTRDDDLAQAGLDRFEEMMTLLGAGSPDDHARADPGTSAAPPEA